MSLLTGLTVEQVTDGNASGAFETVMATQAPIGGGRGGYVKLKSGIEWVSALILLVLAAPLLMALGILVKLTSNGPVGYSQWRLGRFGRPFRIYKLRTMSHECEAGTGPVWATENDPRVTRVGRWLRDTHLDEIPQLLNVVCGHMSLIGPRPERPEIAAEVERMLPKFRDRLLVRPGITGLAQMRLPADSDLDTVRRKLSHDLYYIRHLSPWLDARLALSTPLRLLGEICLSLSRRLVQATVAPLPITAPQSDLAPADPAMIHSGRSDAATEPWAPPWRSAA